MDAKIPEQRVMVKAPEPVIETLNPT